MSVTFSSECTKKNYNYGRFLGMFWFPACFLLRGYLQERDPVPVCVGYTIACSQYRVCMRCILHSDLEYIPLSVFRD